MKLSGGCSCRAVRYRLLRAPLFVHCCHCRDCQNQTGSAFVINALIETREIELLQGKLARVAPDVHVFTRSKLPWVVLPEGVPAFAVYYDRQKLWPRESLARLAEVVA